MGAVRSGKSYSSLFRFLQELIDGPAGTYVIVGKSERSIKRNIVDALLNIVGTGFRYRQGIGEIDLFGKRVYLVGANDMRSEGKIRGATFAGAYVDEITIIPESFFKMLLSRLSVDNAKLIGTTNPDSPYHWFKKQYIDQEEILDLKKWDFVLEDNPALSPTFVDALKKEYQGVWYQRFIEGKWVLAEGIIFDFFNVEEHTLLHHPGEYPEYIVGIDYGTTNPTAFCLIGVNAYGKPQLYVEKEYYYDSQKHMRQKTDYEYAQDLKEFIKGYNVRAIYIDPAAASFKLEMIKQGVTKVYDADNEVLDGIRFMSNLIYCGDLKFNRMCKNIIHELSAYCWDENYKARGVDKPKKENDHICVVGSTLVNTLSFGKIPIKDLVGYRYYLKGYDQEADEYITTIGHNAKKTGTKKRVVKLTLENGKTLTATPDHNVYTKRGYVEIQNLIEDDEVLCYD